jgi:tRNA pseudouridine38-40 synthase
MSRFRLLIEYDGSRYHGWQSNTGVKTIQGEILGACNQLFHAKKIELYGAGRTDAGVHALGQIAHLDVPTQMHVSDIAERLNVLLPYDIHIIKVLSCDPKFHARYKAVARSYVYVISRRRSAFGKKYTWWVKEDISPDEMRTASAIFKGFHNFSSFGAAKDEEESTMVNIEHIQIIESNDSILLHIIGSHFLWMMVRRITGVVVYAGRKKISPEEVRDFLEHHSERPSQLAAPPSGLYLERVYYQGEPINYNPHVPVMI